MSSEGREGNEGGEEEREEDEHECRVDLDTAVIRNDESYETDDEYADGDDAKVVLRPSERASVEKRKKEKKSATTGREKVWEKDGRE